MSDTPDQENNTEPPVVDTTEIVLGLKRSVKALLDSGLLGRDFPDFDPSSPDPHDLDFQAAVQQIFDKTQKILTPGEDNPLGLTPERTELMLSGLAGIGRDLKYLSGQYIEGIKNLARNRPMQDKYDRLGGEQHINTVERKLTPLNEKLAGLADAISDGTLSLTQLYDGATQTLALAEELGILDKPQRDFLQKKIDVAQGAALLNDKSDPSEIYPLLRTISSSLWNKNRTGHNPAYLSLLEQNGVPCNDKLDALDHLASIYEQHGRLNAALGNKLDGGRTAKSGGDFDPGFDFEFDFDGGGGAGDWSLLAEDGVAPWVGEPYEGDFKPTLSDEELEAYESIMAQQREAVRSRIADLQRLNGSVNISGTARDDKGAYIATVPEAYNDVQGIIHDSPDRNAQMLQDMLQKLHYAHLKDGVSYTLTADEKVLTDEGFETVRNLYLVRTDGSIHRVLNRDGKTEPTGHNIMEAALGKTHIASAALMRSAMNIDVKKEQHKQILIDERRDYQQMLLRQYGIDLRLKEELLKELEESSEAMSSPKKAEKEYKKFKRRAARLLRPAGIDHETLILLLWSNEQRIFDIMEAPNYARLIHDKGANPNWHRYAAAHDILHYSATGEAGDILEEVCPTPDLGMPIDDRFFSPALYKIRQENYGRLPDIIKGDILGEEFDQNRFYTIYEVQQIAQQKLDNFFMERGIRLTDASVALMGGDTKSGIPPLCPYIQDLEIVYAGLGKEPIDQAKAFRDRYGGYGSGQALINGELREMSAEDWAAHKFMRIETGLHPDIFKELCVPAMTREERAMAGYDDVETVLRGIPDADRRKEALRRFYANVDNTLNNQSVFTYIKLNSIDPNDHFNFYKDYTGNRDRYSQNEEYRIDAEERKTKAREDRRAEIQEGMKDLSFSDPGAETPPGTPPDPDPDPPSSSSSSAPPTPPPATGAPAVPYKETIHETTDYFAIVIENPGDIVFHKDRPGNGNTNTADLFEINGIDMFQNDRVVINGSLFGADNNPVGGLYHKDKGLISEFVEPDPSDGNFGDNNGVIGQFKTGEMFMYTWDEWQEKRASGALKLEDTNFVAQNGFMLWYEGKDFGMDRKGRPLEKGNPHMSDSNSRIPNRVGIGYNDKNHIVLMYAKKPTNPHEFADMMNDYTTRAMYLDAVKGGLYNRDPHDSNVIDASKGTIPDGTYNFHFQQPGSR